MRSFRQCFSRDDGVGLFFSVMSQLYNDAKNDLQASSLTDVLLKVIGTAMIIYHDYRIVLEQTVNRHIRDVRKKLTELSPHHELIHSIYAIGYWCTPIR